MGSQVKGDREALLTGLQVVSVELVGLLHRAEASILSDCPRLVGVHGGIGTSNRNHHPISYHDRHGLIFVEDMKKIRIMFLSRSRIILINDRKFDFFCLLTSCV